MARYSKFHSNYILRKKHQVTSKGTIWERDWVTIGEQHQIEKGKRPYYNDGNFLFTDNSIAGTKKRHKLSDWVAHWTYDDVKNASDVANSVKVNMTSNDIRDFAYYGSCVELVRSSIFNIVNTFPAQIKSGDADDYLLISDGNGGYKRLSNTERIIKNPFNVDLYREHTVNEFDNPLRWMSVSYADYMLDGSPVTSYSVTFTDDFDPKCDEGLYVTVKIGKVTIKGYCYDKRLIFLSTNTFTLKPKDEIIEEFFDNLDGFEKQLLNRNSKPLYTNRFITPVEGNLTYKYVYRNYCWPSDGYCIDVSTPQYESFLNRLLQMAQTYDELWCDNLYRNMTHEAIQNYDWTYTREYTEGEEQDNIDGGKRVEKLMRIYGRAFDDIKRYIDGIKFVNKNTYDGYNNSTNAEITDKLDISGWEVVSTIPVFDNVNINDVVLKQSTIDKFAKNDNKTKAGKDINWFTAFNMETIDPAVEDVRFMRRLMLSTSKIFATKGTKHAIDMVMGMFGFGNNDYSFTEYYYTTTPKKYTDEIAEAIEITNESKDLPKYYEDIYSGIPLKDVFFGHGKTNHYFVPYYDTSRLYDGELAFQSAGGWGKYSTSASEKNDYTETLSYLRIVSNVGALLSQNPHDLQRGEIVYVVNLADYTEYKKDATDAEIAKLSHFFKLKEDSDDYSYYNSHKFGSWKNLDAKSIGDGKYDPDIAGGTSDDAKRANYLASILSINIGNNPHVGYGKYDLGNTYKEYMQDSLKYAKDNYLIGNNTYQGSVPTFTLSEKSAKTGIVNGVFKDEKIKNIVDGTTEAGKMNSTYYLNNKVFIMKNNLSSDLYKKYFKEIILNYVMQVIPSTTILILEDF